MVKLWLASCHCLGPKNIHTLPPPQHGGSIDVLSGKGVLEFPEGEGEGEHLPRTSQWGVVWIFSGKIQFDVKF